MVAGAVGFAERRSRMRTGDSGSPAVTSSVAPFTEPGFLRPRPPRVPRRRFVGVAPPSSTGVFASDVGSGTGVPAGVAAASAAQSRRGGRLRRTAGSSPLVSAVAAVFAAVDLDAVLVAVAVEDFVAV